MIEMRKGGKGYELTARQWLPVARKDVFLFFADATNLEQLTPDFLHFRIVSALPKPMGEGVLIDYRLRLHGVPIGWRTRICEWDPPIRFVDEQIKGPFLNWVHTHTFEEVDGGTCVKDHVVYRVPGGAFVHRLFVARDVRRIFECRQAAMVGIFGPKSVRAQAEQSGKSS